MDKTTKPNRANVRKLIKSIKEGEFDLKRMKYCFAGHCHSLLGKWSPSYTPIMRFLNIGEKEARWLFIGDDFEGNSFINFDDPNDVAKQKALKFLRQYAR